MYHRAEHKFSKNYKKPNKNSKLQATLRTPPYHGLTVSTSSTVNLTPHTPIHTPILSPKRSCQTLTRTTSCRRLRRKKYTVRNLTTVINNSLSNANSPKTAPELPANDIPIYCEHAHSHSLPQSPASDVCRIASPVSAFTSKIRLYSRLKKYKKLIESKKISFNNNKKQINSDNNYRNKMKKSKSTQNIALKTISAKKRKIKFSKNIENRNNTENEKISASEISEMQNSKIESTDKHKIEYEKKSDIAKKSSNEENKTTTENASTAILKKNTIENISSITPTNVTTASLTTTQNSSSNNSNNMDEELDDIQFKELDAERISKLRKLYKMIDADGENCISKKEAIEFNMALNVNESREAIVKDMDLLFMAVDTNHNGDIDELEWLNGWCRQVHSCNGSTQFLDGYLQSCNV